MTRLEQFKSLSATDLAEKLVFPGSKKQKRTHRESDTAFEKEEIVSGYYTPDGKFFEFFAAAKMHTKFWLLEKEDNDQNEGG